MSTPGTPPKSDSGVPDRWWLLTFVALAYFILILHRSVLFYVQVPLSAEFLLTNAQTGMLDTAFNIPYSIAQLFVAYLSDRFRRRRVLSSSLLLSALALAAMGFVESFAGLLAWRVVLGFVQAAAVPAIAGVMADCFMSKNRSTAIGIYNLSLNVAFIVSGKYGGAFADMPNVEVPLQQFGLASSEVSGWRLAMFVFGFLGVIMAALVGRLMREPARTERDPEQGLGTEGATLWRTILSVLTVPSYWVIAVVYTVVCMVANVQEFWLARYFVEDFAMTNEQAGQFSTVWNRPGMVVGLLVGGFLADRLAQRRNSGRTLIQVLGLIAWIPSLYLLGTSRSPALLAMVMAIIGVGYGFYVANLWTTTFEVIDPAARSTAVGLLNFIAVGAAPAVPIVGWLADNNRLALGDSLAALSILAAAVVVLLLVNTTFFLRHDHREQRSGD